MPRSLGQDLRGSARSERWYCYHRVRHVSACGERILWMMCNPCCLMVSLVVVSNRWDTYLLWLMLVRRYDASEIELCEEI